MDKVALPHQKRAAKYEAKRICEAERKLKERVKNAKAEPMDHHHSRYSQSTLALLATDILELNLAFKENTWTHEHILFGIKMVFRNTERRPIKY